VEKVVLPADGVGVDSIEMGGGHSYVFLEAFDPKAYNRVFEVRDEVNIIGILERHFTTGDVPCRGVLHFSAKKKAQRGDEMIIWNVMNLDPLTLDGSVRCNACGSHGWIRGNLWIAAPDDRSVLPVGSDR
jgi:hypothetical protein